MPLFHVPDCITPELLYALARMGHGDTLTIADANFPSDSVAAHTACKTPLRVTGVSTAELLSAVLRLMPLDAHSPTPVCVMDMVASDKARGLCVPAYAALQRAAQAEVTYVERFQFYEQAKRSFCVVQTSDAALYANVTVAKGVILPSPLSEP